MYVCSDLGISEAADWIYMKFSLNVDYTLDYLKNYFLFKYHASETVGES